MSNITRRFAVAGLVAVAVAAWRFPKKPAALSPKPHPVLPPPPHVLPSAPPVEAIDETVTPSFVETAKEYPVVRDLRRSVFMTECDMGRGMVSQGSALLIDGRTLGMTAHQSHGTHMTVSCLPHPDTGLHYCSTSAVLIAIDRKTDTAFWRLKDPSVIDRFGLVPVKRGYIGNGEHARGDTVLTMGFPAFAHGELDAAPHVLEEYIASERVQGETLAANGKFVKTPHAVTCKVEMEGEAGSGNSGGPVFDAEDGSCLGILTASGNGESSFTPADAMWNGYANLVTSEPPMRMLHPECEMHNAAKKILQADVHPAVLAEQARGHILNRRHFLFPQE